MRLRLTKLSKCWRWAVAGNTEAQYTLSALYVAGKGVPRDTPKAYYWFLLAAGKQAA